MEMGIEIWTDGAGSHGDEPAAVGMVIIEDGVIAWESGQQIDASTTNEAELRAILRGLVRARALYGTGIVATCYTDCLSAITVLTRDRIPKAERDLVLVVRAYLNTMPGIRFQHVSAHSKIFGNELADWLAGKVRARVLRKRGIKKAIGRRPTPDAMHLEMKRSGFIAVA
jgi:ribonuclease HI